MNIPRSLPKQEIGNMPGNHFAGGAIPDAFGTGIAQAAGKTGDKLGETLVDMSKYIEKQQEEAAKVAAMEKKVAFTEKLFGKLHDQKTGILTLKGSQADGISTSFSTWTKDTIAEMESQITNPYEKQLFKQHVFPIYMASLGDVSKHEQKERTVRLDNAYKSSVANHIVMGAAGYNSPETVKFNEASIEKLVTDKFANQDKATLDFEMRAAKTKLFQSIFTRFIENNDTESARKVFKEHGSKMDPDVVGLMQTTLDKQGKYDSYDSAWKETRNMSVEELDNYINSRKDWSSEMKIGFKGYHSNQVSRINSEKTKMETEQYKNLMVELGPYLDSKDINGALKIIDMKNLPADRKNSAIAVVNYGIFGRDNRPSDKEAVWAMYKDVTEGKITNEDQLKAKYGDKVNIGEIISYARVIKSIQADFAKANRTPDGFSFNESVTYKFKERGIDSPEDRAGAWEMFGKWTDDYKSKNNGKLPSNQVMLDSMEIILGQQVIIKQRDFWFNKKEHLYKLQKENPGVLIMYDSVENKPFTINQEGKKIWLVEK